MVPKMPKKAKELSALEVSNLTKPGVHAVGSVAGLCLQVSESGAKSWILRTMVGEKRKEIGLGGYPDVSLAQARGKAREIKEQIRKGIDPVAERKAKRSELIAQQALLVNFKMVAAEYITKKSKEFKTDKQTQKLSNHMKNYVYPFIGNMVISDISRAHIVNLLEPIWETKNETASRVRLHVERILDLAGVKGLRQGDNPARWKGNLEHTFADRNKIAPVKHLNALPVKDMAKFWQLLTDDTTQGSKALQFIILTACRSGEARGASWEEIDLAKKVWTIPAERMKGGKAHKVPLCATAIELLQSLPNQQGPLFTNARGGAITDVTISKTPKRLGYDVTAHGFRATFRTWAQEFTSYADEVCELALAHVNDDKTRAAYARSQLLEKRRLLMNDWEHFCRTGHGLQKEAKVVAIGGGAA